MDPCARQPPHAPFLFHQNTTLLHVCQATRQDMPLHLSCVTVGLSSWVCKAPWRWAAVMCASTTHGPYAYARQGATACSICGVDPLSYGCPLCADVVIVYLFVLHSCSSPCISPTGLCTSKEGWRASGAVAGAALVSGRQGTGLCGGMFGYPVAPLTAGCLLRPLLLQQPTCGGWVWSPMPSLTVITHVPLACFRGPWLHVALRTEAARAVDYTSLA